MDDEQEAIKREIAEMERREQQAKRDAAKQRRAYEKALHERRAAAKRDRERRRVFERRRANEITFDYEHSLDAPQDIFDAVREAVGDDDIVMRLREGLR